VRGTDIVIEEKLVTRINELRIHDADSKTIIDLLGELTFFGYEVAPNRFEFLYDQDNSAKVLAMARKTADEMNAGVRRFRIHPAYHAYLELTRTSAQPGQLAIEI
jgi:hypothetical protein